MSSSMTYCNYCSTWAIATTGSDRTSYHPGARSAQRPGEYASMFLSIIPALDGSCTSLDPSFAVALRSPRGPRKPSELLLDQSAQDELPSLTTTSFSGMRTHIRGNSPFADVMELIYTFRSQLLRSTKDSNFRSPPWALFCAELHITSSPR